MSCARGSKVTWSLFLLLSLVGTQDPAQAQTRQPNILFLLADDHRPDAWGAGGNAHVETPNLDALAHGGFRFTRNYCMGSRHGAVCAPSRAMLMSGRTLHRVRDDLRGVETLPERLRAAGYATFITGKWHNGKAALLRSFESGRSVMLGGMSDHTRVPLVDILAGKRELGARRTGEGHSSELFSAAAIGFLEHHAKARRNQPFFAYVSFTAPHDPRDPPPSYRLAYARKHIPLPPNFRPQHVWNFDEKTLTVRDERLAAWPRREATVRSQLGEYYGLISHMDAQIGRILKKLESTGLRERTIVIYSADHGLAMGSHGLLGKQSLYEHSMGCPLIFNGPGIPAGKTSRALTYLLDLYPTLAAVSGVSTPGAVEGQSLLPLIAGTASRVRASLFTLYKDNQRAVRDERYKLIRFPRINKSLLFDLHRDPHELEDLAPDPSHAKRLGRMFALLKTWQERVGDACPLTSDSPSPARIDLGGRPRKPDRHQPAWIRKKYFSSGG